MQNENAMSISGTKSIEQEAETFLQLLNRSVIEPNHSADPNEYRNRFETLLGAVKLSHSREHSLIEKYQSIQSDKDATVKELQSSHLANKEHENHVMALKNDLDTMKSLLQAANDQGDNDKVAIGKLQDEIEVLRDQIDKSESSLIGKEKEVNQLVKDVEHWKEHVRATSEKNDAMKMIEQKLKSEMDKLQILYNESQESNLSMKECILEKETEIKRSKDRQEQLERELEETQTKLENKTKEYTDKEYEAAVAQSKLSTMEKQFIDAKKIIAVKEQEVKDELSKKENVVTMLDDQKSKMNRVSEELKELEIQQRKSIVERNRLSSENTKLERSLDSERKAVLRHQQSSNEEVQSLKKEMGTMRKREDQLNKEIMLLKRENGLQLGKIQVIEEKAKKTGNVLRYNEQVIASLEKELVDAKTAMTKQDTVTRRLEGECDGLRHQVTESRASYERIIDELKLRDNRMKDLTRTIEDLEISIQEEKQKHETIRSERNNTLKLLKDEQQEVEKMQHHQKKLQKEIDALQTEVANKDSALVKENYDYRKEKAQKELYADEISRLKRIIVENEEKMQIMQSEVKQLGTAIRKLDDTALLQRKEYDQIMNERNILGTQLIRRNDERALLYEKINIIQSTLRRGEIQYNARIEDIRLLKIKMRDLQRQLTIARGGQSSIEDLNGKLIAIQKELVKEKVKVKALSDELENPINIHRWRKLEGTDPEAHEMIQKIQVLQKRLLAKSEEVRVQSSYVLCRLLMQ